MISIQSKTNFLFLLFFTFFISFQTYSADDKGDQNTSKKEQPPPLFESTDDSSKEEETEVLGATGGHDPDQSPSHRHSSSTCDGHCMHQVIAHAVRANATSLSELRHHLSQFLSKYGLNIDDIVAGSGQVVASSSDNTTSEIHTPTPDDISIQQYYARLLSHLSSLSLQPGSNVLILLPKLQSDPISSDDRTNLTILNDILTSLPKDTSVTVVTEEELTNIPNYPEQTVTILQRSFMLYSQEVELFSFDYIVPVRKPFNP